MNVLIIGSGGREHALAWQCAKFSEVSRVFVAPGNAGTLLEDKITNINITATHKLIEFAKANAIHLTIVGPEKPLVDGIVNEFNQHDLAIFGPTKQAAMLEGSKIFSKQFMTKHNIPTAFYKVFAQVDSAMQFVKKQDLPIVIKADGLAAGKGVSIVYNLEQAEKAISDILINNKFGTTTSVIIEEFIKGEEASFIVMTDGTNIIPMATSQDHKALYDGDTGQNTGGMGAYSPAPIINNKLSVEIIKKVIEPTISAMANNNTPYVGFLYAGVIINDDGIKVLEFNCRFGDPEAQPIMMRLNTNLAKLCLLATKAKLNEATISWNDQSALGVVLASSGYPNSFNVGEKIVLPKTTKDIKIFHAATKLTDGVLTNNGGRVLCVTSLGDNIAEAKNKAYSVIDKIKWSNAYFRKDIGYKALR